MRLIDAAGERVDAGAVDAARARRARADGRLVGERRAFEGDAVPPFGNTLGPRVGSSRARPAPATRSAAGAAPSRRRSSPRSRCRAGRRSDPPGRCRRPTPAARTRTQRLLPAHYGSLQPPSLTADRCGIRPRPPAGRKRRGSRGSLRAARSVSSAAAPRLRPELPRRRRRSSGTSAALGTRSKRSRRRAARAREARRG